MKEITNINVDLENISLLSIRVLTANFYISPECIDTKIGGYQLEFTVENGVNIEEKAIRIIIEGLFHATDENESRIDANCELSAEFIFYISDMENYIQNDNRNKDLGVVHPSVGDVILGVAYSTFRGIVFARSQGNFKEPIILPVMSPQKLMDEFYKKYNRAG